MNIKWLFTKNISKLKQVEVNTKMLSKKRLWFNISMVTISWLSLLFIGKTSLKRYSFAGLFIIGFEILNHLYAYKKKWWTFYEKPRDFLRNELPFSLGPYMPLSLWLLKLSKGNFIKFISLNAIGDGFFAFIFMAFLKKMKIVRLNRINPLQFFIYLHYKAYLLYGVQHLVDKRKGN